MTLRGLLACGELPYSMAVRARNRWYDHHASAVHRVESPVISVGNLTVGGTGKTPMVKWLARYLLEQSLRVAIVSRGYGAESGEAGAKLHQTKKPRPKNDEALELEQALPDVPHLQDKDRVAAALEAVAQYQSQILLLDDGFQHRRLGRDLDIVLLDATAPFGYGHLLPRGALREPVTSLIRAGVVCLTRASSMTPAERLEIRQQVELHAPGAVWCEANHAPSGLLTAGGAQQPLATIAGKQVAAFCGIGNPDAFRRTLQEADAKVKLWRTFPDHHRYTAGDIAELETAIRQSGAELVVCTHKDLVKTPVESLADTPLHAVVVEMQLLAGEQELLAKINRVTQSITSAPHDQPT